MLLAFPPLRAEAVSLQITQVVAAEATAGYIPLRQFVETALTATFSFAITLRLPARKFVAAATLLTFSRQFRRFSSDRLCEMA